MQYGDILRAHLDGLPIRKLDPNLEAGYVLEDPCRGGLVEGQGFDLGGVGKCNGVFVAEAGYLCQWDALLRTLLVFVIQLSASWEDSACQKRFGS